MSKTSKYEQVIIDTQVVERLAAELHNNNLEETDKWLFANNEYLFGMSPMQVIHLGDAKILIKWLKELLGKE